MAHWHVAQGFSSRGVPTPLVKEVVIHPTLQKDSGSKYCLLTGYIQVPILGPAPLSRRDESLEQKPLSLWVKAVSSKSIINSFRGSRGKQFLNTSIANAHHKFIMSQQIIPVNTYRINKNNYLSYNPSTKKHLYFEDIKFEVRVRCPNGQLSKLKHLSLVCVVFSNFGSLHNATPTHLHKLKDNPLGRLDSGAPMIVNIINNRRVPLRSSYYVLRETLEGWGEKGDIWPGAVHKHQGWYMAGSSHSNTKHPRLRKITTANYKVKDLRFLDPQFSGQMNGFSVSQRSSPARAIGPTSLGAEEKVAAYGIEKYFSSPHYSRQSDGSALAFLNFDFMSYIKDHLEFKWIIKSEDSITSCGEILDLRVHRYRVTNTDLSSPLTPGHATTPPPPCSERLLLPIETISYVPTTNPGTVGILIEDSKMSAEPEGLYGYRIEIDVIDNSRKAIQHLADKVAKEFRKFENFLTVVNERSTKGSWGNNSYVKKHAQSLEDNSNYKQLVNLVIASLRFLFFRGSPVILKNNLLSMASPYSATLDSMYMFRDLIANYLYSLKRLVEEPIELNSERPFNNDSKIFSKEITKTNTIVFEIGEAYQNFSQEGRRVGFDYFGSTWSLEDTKDVLPLQLTAPLPGAPLLIVSFDAFVDRIVTESKKYVDFQRNDLALNKYGFLSPLVVRTPYKSLVTQKNMSLDSSLDILYAKRNAVSSIEDYPGTPQNRPTTNYYKRGLLGLEGVTYKPKKISLRELVKTTPNKTLNYIDSVSYFSSGSVFVNMDEISAVEASISGSKTTQFAMATAARQSGLQLKKRVVSYLLQELAQDYIENIELKNSNLIKGSFAYNQMVTNPKSVENLNIFEKSINWNSLVEVQYFVGSPSPNSKTPEWQTLTQSQFKRMRARGGSVLCRLKRLPSIFNVKNSFDLPIYNHLFILGPSIPIEAPLWMVPSSRTAEPRYITTFAQTIHQVRSLNQKSAQSIGTPVYSEYLMSRESVLNHKEGSTIPHAPGKKVLIQKSAPVLRGPGMRRIRHPTRPTRTPRSSEFAGAAFPAIERPSDFAAVAFPIAERSDDFAGVAFPIAERSGDFAGVAFPATETPGDGSGGGSY